MTPDDDRGPTEADRTLSRSLETFNELSSALGLSEAENRALLDLTPDSMAALRSGGQDLAAPDTPKLQRRLDYAIPILRRMLAAQAS